MTGMACPSTFANAFLVTPPDRTLELDDVSNIPLLNVLVKRKEKDTTKQSVQTVELCLGQIQSAFLNVPKPIFKSKKCKWGKAVSVLIYKKIV